MDTEKTCYLFFDYDGTVYTHATFAPENVKAMQKAQKLGHKLILNTGRSRGGLDLEVSRSAGICWNGTVFGAVDIEFDGVHYPTSVMSARKGREWMRFALKNHIQVIFEGERECFNFDMREKHGTLTRQEKKEQVKKLKVFLKDDRLTKLTFVGITPKMKKLPQGPGKMIWHKTYSEMFQDGMDKGTAILRFCELTGADLSQCVCFGDSMNDEGMFRVAPTSVAMRGAPDEIKNIATFVAEGNFGVAEGFHWLFDKNNS